MDLVARVVLAVQAASSSHPSTWLLALSGFIGGFAVGVAGMGVGR